MNTLKKMLLKFLPTTPVVEQEQWLTESDIRRLFVRPRQ